MNTGKQGTLVVSARGRIGDRMTEVGPSCCFGGRVEGRRRAFSGDCESVSSKALMEDCYHRLLEELFGMTRGAVWRLGDRGRA